MRATTVFAFVASILACSVSAAAIPPGGHRPCHMIKDIRKQWKCMGKEAEKATGHEIDVAGEYPAVKYTAIHPDRIAQTVGKSFIELSYTTGIVNNELAEKLPRCKIRQKTNTTPCTFLVACGGAESAGWRAFRGGVKGFFVTPNKDICPDAMKVY